MKIAMSRTIDTREEVLAAAHRVVGNRITVGLPGPHDDAEAEYAEDQLDDAAARHARTVLQTRLEKGVPRSAIEANLRKECEKLLDDAGSDAGLPRAIRQLASEAAVMELALVEIVRKRPGDVLDLDLDLDEARGIAADALPEGAARRATYAP
jgi:hypothetical protein